MPAKYSRMKHAMMSKGMPEKEAKSMAAAKYVSQGKGKEARSKRAKSLKQRKYQ